MNHIVDFELKDINMFEVSVIIPVYNAELFLRSAVESALKIECVREILLIEDGSPDNCLAICEELSSSNEKIRLLQHPEGQNRGAGASRNLGIENARCEYIAFLDADDFYLPNRFEQSRVLFLNERSLDFTYGCAQYEEEYNNKTKRFKCLRYLNSNESLFDILIKGNRGFFHTNSVTIKRTSLTDFKLFNPALKLHQDTELWLRLSYQLKSRCEVADYGPTAIIRQHENNRIIHRNDLTNHLLWSIVREEFKDKSLTYVQRALINEYSKKPINNKVLSKLQNFIKKTKIKILQNF